jgi:hypothetical protein
MKPAHQRIARIALALLHFAVALTAVASGAVIVLGSVWPASFSGVGLPPEYLYDSPFNGYLVPGAVLIIVVGGSHVLAFVGQVRITRSAAFLSAVAAFALLIWIFVQMIFIPFSFLQAIFFAVGIAEAGFVMLSLGVLALGPDHRDRVPADQGHHPVVGHLPRPERRRQLHG